MRNPRLTLSTDDNMSMTSELYVTISKTLSRIDLTHIKQNGGEELIQIFPSQVKHLVKFLKEAEIWIKSGYKKELTPTSFNELK